MKKLIIIILFATLCSCAGPNLTYTDSVISNTRIICGQMSSFNAKYIFIDLKQLSQVYNTITIWINSSGGSIESMWSIFDEIEIIKQSGITINTHVSGEIASAGVLIYLAGEHRTITRNSYVMIHPHSWHNNPMIVGLTELTDMGDYWSYRYAEILAERTNMTLLEALDILTPPDADYITGAKYFTAEEAVELGIAHEIVG